MNNTPITDQLITILNQSLERLNLPKNADLKLEQPANQQFGDYASNVAMVLFGQLSSENNSFEYSNPRQLAEALAADMLADDEVKNHPAIAEITVAGPGFINFALTEAFLAVKMAEIAADPSNAVLQTGKGQKIVVEYSSPNIAKPFTVGHLRSTIIGDAVANLLEASGAEVYRDNHLGDWGTQFGKQIYAIKTWGDEDQIENSDNPVKELVELYVKFHQEADENPELMDEGRAWFKKLEDGDAEARRLWEKCINWSWKEFSQIYDRLGVQFTENGGRGFGESYFEDKMGSVIEQLKEKGLLQESEGAQLVFFPDEKYPPLMILKNDGTTLYATRELATDLFRLNHYGSDVVVINETGSEQSLYFQQLFETERLLGWYQEGQRLHIGHGMIRFKEGKMSTRKGNVIWLEDVLQEAFSRVDGIAKAKLDEASKWDIAIGALKWNDLKRSPQLSVTFDWDEVLSLKGNSGPYIQYTHVRCESIFAKAEAEWGIEVDSLKSDITKHIDILRNLLIQNKIQLSMIEKDMLRNINSYYETYNLSVSEKSPHHLANALYELAQSFNTFYNDHMVVDDSGRDYQSAEQLSPETHLRLLITYATAAILSSGLAVLGIKTVEKM